MNTFRQQIKTIVILFLLFVFIEPIFAQNKHEVDSLCSLFKKEKHDTTKINLLIAIGRLYENVLPDTAIYYYNMALSAATIANSKKQIALSYTCLGDIKKNLSVFDVAMDYYSKSLKIYETINYKYGIARTNNRIGNIYRNWAEYEKALEYYKKSLKMEEEIDDKQGMANCINNIGNVYINQKVYITALEYYFKALEIYKASNDKGNLWKCYGNIGSVYYTQRIYATKALEYFFKSLKISKEIGNMFGAESNYASIAEVYYDEGEYNKSLEYFYNAYNIATDLSDKNEMSKNLSNIAKVFIKLKTFNKAIESADKGLDIALELKNFSLQENNYKYLSAAYDSLKDYEKAFQFQKLLKKTKDSILNIDKKKQMANIQAKYETDKKKSEIEKLNSEQEARNLKLKEKTIRIYSFAGGVILLLILAFSILNLYKQKQSKRKMLSNVIETEEKERKRFAEDLHDGLGPLLSSIGLYVNELKSDRHETAKKTEFLNYTSELIDDAIKNTRMIASNLMPGVLNDYGLVNALDTFCGKLKKTGAINVEVRSDLKDKKYPAVIEITLYRVVLELINNALKHAKANNIIVEISELDKNIIVKYNDDGKGFDFEKTKNDPLKGLGLNNIINRINSINGKCVFKSAEGKGTTVYIDVNYKKFV